MRGILVVQDNSATEAGRGLPKEGLSASKEKDESLSLFLLVNGAYSLVKLNRVKGCCGARGGKKKIPSIRKEEKQGGLPKKGSRTRANDETLLNKQSTRGGSGSYGSRGERRT